MNDDLRTQAKEAAEAYAPMNEGLVSADTMGERWAYSDGFRAGFLAHAAQQPSREQIARVLALTDDYDGCFERIGTDEECSFDREDCEWWLARADAVLALLGGGRS